MLAFLFLRYLSDNYEQAARKELGPDYPDPGTIGKTYPDRNAKLCTIITKIAEGLAEFSTDSDTLGDAYG